MPNIPAELIGRDQMRAWGTRVPEFVEFLVQTTTDRYQRIGDDWEFTERIYEVRYQDTTPLAGSPAQVRTGGR
ncbi:MAG TPA: hypothetical protein VGI00_18050 [Streptosporangiaceae bacterium]|jgi:hypothetical protein